MTRKRLFKLLMGSGIARDSADALVSIANMIEPSYEVAWLHILDSLRAAEGAGSAGDREGRPYGKEVQPCE